MKIYLCGIGLLLNIGLCYAQNPKIGLVDMDILLSTLPEKDSLEQLAKWFEETCLEGLKKEEKIAMDYYQKIMQEAQSYCGSSPDYYKKQEEKLQNMQLELQKLALSANSALQVVDSTFQMYMHLQIEAASQQVGKEQGYQLILKKKDCLFYNLNWNITGLVLTELEQREQQQIQKQLDLFRKQLHLSIQNIFEY